MWDYADRKRDDKLDEQMLKVDEEATDKIHAQKFYMTAAATKILLNCTIKNF